MTKLNLAKWFVFSLLLSACTSKVKLQEKHENIPGYYEQWLYMKTNGTNVLPDMRQYAWDVNSSKRSTSDALINVYEFGPRNVGGRVRAIVCDYSNPNHLIAGGASGGVFVSNDNGASWRAINDQALSPSVTYMQQNPFQPNVIYYCTGEYSGNSADLLGSGVFKSTDGGNTFEQLSSTNRSEFQYCWSLKCSPKDTNTLYVSTNSSGIWKSTDAGATFTRVYNTASQINDIEVLPDGSVLFTIKGSGVFRSATGDVNTFAKVSSVSSTTTGRGELAYCKNAPNVVYAAISGPDNTYDGVLDAFYKSSDGGKTFTQKTNPNGVINFGFTWYAMTMEVNPLDSNDIYIGSLDAGYSYNGGNTWNDAAYSHSDHHMSVTGANNLLYVGCDGGMSYYSWNNFANYTLLNNGLNVTQFYHGSISETQGYVFGGCQDNGTKESRNQSQTFTTIYGGDGGYSFYYPGKQNSRYFATQNGAVYLNGQNISNNVPTGSTDAKWFIQPYCVSPTYGKYVVYPSSTYLYFSSNDGAAFRSLGKINSGRLFCAEISPDANPSVFSGGSNALVAVDSVMNATPKYKDLRSLMPTYVRSSFIGAIKIIPGFRDKIYLALNNIADSGRVWKVSNVFGTPVFTNISRSLPRGLPVNWVECDPLNPERVIFAGTDYGLYVTEDGGQTWVKDTRIPNTVVSCIKIRNNNKDIYFFTHGRGIFKGQINNAAFSSINEQKIDLVRSAYPIPSNTVLNIELRGDESCPYSIVDLQGKLVFKGKLEPGANSIPMSEIPAGNYILIYRSENQEGELRFNVVH